MNDRAINLWQIQHRGLDFFDTLMLGYCEWFNQCYAQLSSPFQGTFEQTELGYSPDHILGYLATTIKLSLYQKPAETEMTRQKPVR